MRTDFSKITKSSISSYDATVGIGGDYPNVGSAIADGKSNLLLVSDVVEIEDIIINIKLFNINLNNYEFYLDTYSFLLDSGTINIFNGTIVLINPVRNSSFYTRGNSKIYFDKCKIINNSTTNGKNIIRAYGRHVLFTNCKFYIPNYADVGVDGSCLKGGIYNSEIIGGGTNSTFGGVSGGTYLENVLFTGTFSTSAWNLRNTKMFNCLIDASCTLWIQNANLVVVSGSAIVTINRIYGILENSDLGEGKVSIGSDSRSSNSKISNVIAGQLCIYSQAINVSVIDSIFKSTTLISNINADKVKINNTVFEEALTITSNNVTVNGCILENGTITIDATADKTNISNCRTLTSISDTDFGTNTILQNNQLI